jgi:hypothetical protein
MFLDIVARPFEKQSFRCGRLTLVYAFCWPIEDGRSIRPLRGYFTPHFMKPLSAWLFAMLSTPDYPNSVGDLATSIGNDEKSDQLWSRNIASASGVHPGNFTEVNGVKASIVAAMRCDSPSASPVPY